MSKTLQLERPKLDTPRVHVTMRDGLQGVSASVTVYQADILGLMRKMGVDQQKIQTIEQRLRTRRSSAA